ncbi:MAG: DNA-binding protein WhiA [Clostridia bacterium]|nr:DNA-binding protein WhiA [Clostridia bacterium]
MSFSQDIKEEILNNLKKVSKSKCCQNAERFGELITESGSIENFGEFKIYYDISKLKECCIKAILKGVFLASGCIVNPESNYHLEIVFRNKNSAEYIHRILEVLDFTAKIVKRKNTSTSYILYIKESDQIGTFLSLIEAYASLLKFEEIRVEKEVKNNINRSVNCETANLAKLISNSVKQIEAINKLKKKYKFFLLDEKLKYVANLRLENKEASLDKLASLTFGENKLSKSGIKRRLDRIIEISQDIGE